MTRREFEEALEAWREAERRLASAQDDPQRGKLQADVDAAREAFQALSGEYMLDRLDDLQEAESERQSHQASTDTYHEAARRETEIAADIFDTAQINDRAIPHADEQQNQS